MSGRLRMPSAVLFLAVPRPAARSDQAGAYDVASLIEDDDPVTKLEVTKLLSEHSHWTPDVVGELLKLGVFPPIVGVADGSPVGDRTHLTCTFLTPSGARLSGVVVPRSVVRLFYPSHCADGL